MNFDQILKARRSVRVYDENAGFDSQIVTKSLERSVLSANSSNMQLWEFYQISSEEKKKKIVRACMHQSAARTASELVVFVTRHDKWKKRAAWNLANMEKQFVGKEITSKDKRALNYYKKLMPLFYTNDFLGIATLIRFLIVSYHTIIGKPIIHLITHADQRVSLHKTCALAAQTFMLSMKSENYDTCPMEGFDERIIKRILNLPASAEVCMVIACGIGKSEGIYGPRTRVPNDEVIFKV
ncbi:nitroreductase [Emticicia oligotrophica DSM 17448]|uniref:Nitroreductase n=1 Tax=Emticicia oligotrophica (strain DSM 17448 / CIP 109782 / MTCC 6937 / GPTSA100-15) TaxID=929562 RepID=A0ABM5N612_EMTOG|nr:MULTISPECIES: nitroreductase family protein [Emticicia]AFK04969.1 nitroreductase [Emticicia oligotrophica DSM 17448]